MIDTAKLLQHYDKIVGWKQHHNINDIEIDVALTETESGFYFQDFHRAVTLPRIAACLERNKDLNEYLQEVKEIAIKTVFHDVLKYRNMHGYGKSLLSDSILLNKNGFRRDTITNQGRFVGFLIRLNFENSLSAIIKQIGFQFTQPTDLTLYLYHTNVKDPLETLDVSISGAGFWEWKNAGDQGGFKLDSYGEEYNGGAFVLGYYQDDLDAGNAVNYTDFDWSVGECRSCNSTRYSVWQNIAQYYQVSPIYVPFGNYTVGEMFELDNAIYTRHESYGLNMKLSAVCDLTQFFMENSFVFQKLLGIKTCILVLEMMKHSDQINYIEENLKGMIIRDLEGDVDTKKKNMPTQYFIELKAAELNMSSISETCLPCKDESTDVKFGFV